MPRLVRDLLILLAIAGLFAGFYFLRLSFGSTTRDPNASAFSEERQTADRAARDQNWTEAAANYEILTQQDPYNSFAWYSLAECKWMQSAPIQAELKRERLAAEPSQERIDELEGQLQEMGKTAIDLFARAGESGRYRLMAGQSIAAIHVALGQKDQAFSVLEKCLEDGLPWRSIWSSPQFIELRGDPRYSALSDRNRQSPGRYPTPVTNGGTGRK